MPHEVKINDDVIRYATISYKNIKNFKIVLNMESYQRQVMVYFFKKVKSTCKYYLFNIYFITKSYFMNVYNMHNVLVQ